MTPKISNVNISDRLGTSADSRVALCWEAGGARYHAWVALDTLELNREGFNSNVIYKNPPLSVKYLGDGYFPTRRLDPSAKVNAAMLLEAQDVARRNDLVGALLDREDDLKRRQAAEVAEHEAFERTRDAAPDLYEALLQVLDGATMPASLESIGRRALAKAKA